jgi:hypothetical protein
MGKKPCVENLPHSATEDSLKRASPTFSASPLPLFKRNSRPNKLKEIVLPTPME